MIVRLAAGPEEIPDMDPPDAWVQTFVGRRECP
jgi:hypothetical protein